MAHRPYTSPRALARRQAGLTALEYQLRIELKRVEPLIWRRVLVPDNVTLVKLHAIIQGTMGWLGSHLHEYRIGPSRYGIPDDDRSSDEPVIDERRVHLKLLLESGVRRFTYLYDLGDLWEHGIEVEDITIPPVHGGRIRCLAGENACPPDDVGGIPGYFDFLRALKDPTHERHSEMRRWIGGSFDPVAFDISDTNARLTMIKP